MKGFPMRGKHKDFVIIEGWVLLVLAAAMIVPFVMGLAMGEHSAALGFMWTIIFCAGLGAAIVLAIKPSPEKFKSRDGFFVVTITWFIASLAGALPFMISGSIPGFADAFFESASGFSTTGSSILTDIEIMPKSILFWRSFTHWLGGMGIIVFVMALLPAIGISGQLVAYAETPGPVKDKMTAKFADTAKGLYKIYIGMTLVQVLLLKLGKMSWYDAWIHTFGSVGTGGFSNYNTSVAHFDSMYIELVIIVFMVLSGINFNLYYGAFIQHRGIKTIFKDDETKFYLTAMGVAALLIFGCNSVFSGFQNPGGEFMDAVFHVTSITTTTGYASGDYDLWPTFSKLVLFALFFFGGCSGSTGGGVKHIRILVALKLVRRSFSLKIHPNRVIPVRINGRELSNDVVIKITNFIFIYIATLFVGIMLIGINGLDFMTTVSTAATCLGNIGPGFNLVGPTMNFAVLSDFSKIICSFLMIAGRLELYTVFILFSKYYWNSNKA